MTPDDKAEWLAERAAIREYDGGQQRQEAEVGALEDWERTYGEDGDGEASNRLVR